MAGRMCTCAFSAEARHSQHALVQFTADRVTFPSTFPGYTADESQDIRAHVKGLPYCHCVHTAVSPFPEVRF